MSAAGGATADKVGTADADATRGKAPAELRDRPAPDNGKRGRGRPPGSKTGAGSAAAPAPAKPPTKTPDFVYSKVGRAFSAMFTMAAVKTNCSVWLLSEAEQKDLGESFGDILLDLGMVDNTVTKVVFAAGTLVAVGGIKAASYAAYVAANRKPLPAKAPAVAGVPPAVPDPIKERSTDDSIIPDNASGKGAVL